MFRISAVTIESGQAPRLAVVTLLTLAAFGCAQAAQQAKPEPAAAPAAGQPPAETAKPAPATPAASTQKPAAPATQKPPARDAAAATQKPAPGTQKPAAEAAKGPAKPSMATSADKTPIAWESGGTGPALILVQGAGETRRSWQERGYAERLRKQFTVITFDRRGTGDSGKPVARDAYALDTVLADIIAVADAAGAKRFHLWAFGDGAAIARYLTARSDRVISAVMVGATLGPALTGIAKDAVTVMRDKWRPLVEASAAGTLDVKALSPGDKAAWDNGIAISALSLGALIDFPPLEPNEIKVPTLWLVGAEDSALAANAKEYEGKVKGSSVTLKVLSSLSYSDTFIKSEVLLAEAEPFLLKTK
jgi:pimeloyl-ACP methyl ester carboxylesterase